jgi:hypothetical protein
MDETKTIIVPKNHIIEIEYGRAKMKLYNPRLVRLTVSVRKATKADK